MDLVALSGLKSDRSAAQEIHRIKETVMAKVIEFYIPKSFRNPFVRPAQLQPGKLIDFSSQAKKSLPTRPAGEVLGWLLMETESAVAIGSEWASRLQGWLGRGHCMSCNATVIESTAGG